MQLRSKISLCVTLIYLILSPWKSFAQGDKTFRTPAKMYAGAYTVKIQLKKDFTTYDVPVWIKPDLAESAFDPTLLKDLGYVDHEIVFDEVSISNHLLEKNKFKASKTEWAFVPDFAKSCCYGVLGRDVLKDFEIRFDPKNPTHLEWTRLGESEKSTSMAPSFIGDLHKVFSLTQNMNVPFVLNLQERKFKLEATPEKASPTIFSFFFVPPDRVIQITALNAKEMKSAKKVGFKSGLVITKINGEKVSDIDRWEIEQYLRGDKGPKIQLVAKDKKEFTYDFGSHQFIESEKK